MKVLARIGLVNIEPDLVEALERSSQSRTRVVRFIPMSLPADRAFQISDLDHFDLVILDVTLDNSDSQGTLSNLMRLRSKTGLRPMVLCLSRTYRGPHFQYDLERKGARVVYVS